MLTSRASNKRNHGTCKYFRLLSLSVLFFICRCVCFPIVVQVSKPVRLGCFGSRVNFGIARRYVCARSARPTSGQGNLGSITGTVQDTSGAVVPDAALTVTNIETNVKWTAKTSSAGYYRVAVPPGRYRLEAEKQGFKTEVAENVLVPVAQVVTLDLTLQVGNQSQRVEVTSQTPLLTPSTAEVSSAVSAQEFETLPIEVGDGGRQLQTFIFTSLPELSAIHFRGRLTAGSSSATKSSLTESRLADTTSVVEVSTNSVRGRTPLVNSRYRCPIIQQSTARPVAGSQILLTNQERMIFMGRFLNTTRIPCSMLRA